MPEPTDRMTTASAPTEMILEMIRNYPCNPGQGNPWFEAAVDCDDVDYFAHILEERLSFSIFEGEQEDAIIHRLAAWAFEHVNWKLIARAVYMEWRIRKAELRS